VTENKTGQQKNHAPNNQMKYETKAADMQNGTATTMQNSSTVY